MSEITRTRGRETLAKTAKIAIKSGRPLELAPDVPAPEPAFKRQPAALVAGATATKANTELDNEDQEQLVLQFTELKHRICRILLDFFTKFCHVQLKNTDDDDHHEGHSSIGKKFSLKRIRTTWWSRLVFLVGAICLARMLIWLYYQYMYDYHRLKLSQFQASPNKLAAFSGMQAELCAAALKQTSKKCSNYTVDSIELKIRADIEHYRRTLKSVGAPILRTRFVIECPLVILVILLYLPYVQPMIYFNCIQRIDLFFANLMVDERLESQRCRRLISDQVRQVLLSSANYVRESGQLARHLIYKDAELADSSSEHEVQQQQKQQQPNAASRLAKILEEHEWTERILLDLGAAHELEPINRSKEWVDATIVRFNATVIGNLVYSFLFDSAVILWLLVYHADADADADRATHGPLELLAMLELLILCEISVFATGFYLALLVCSAADQTNYADHMARQMLDCIQLNDQLHTLATLSPHHGYDESDTKRGLVTAAAAAAKWDLNRRLLLALMRYKIFLKEFKPLNGIFKFGVLDAVCIMFSIPTVIRLHSRYMPEEVMPLGIYFNLIVMLFSDLLYLPVANFYYNAMRLYKSLYALAAHVAELNTSTMSTDDQQQQQHHQQVNYFEHSQWLLVKELAHPETLADQFVTDVFGFKVTYPNVVRVHYWFSAVVISVYLDVQSLRDIFGDYLDDPLRLMKYT